MSIDDTEITWPAWAEAERGLREAWARGYPNEKIVKLDPNGNPDVYVKEKARGEARIDEYGAYHQAHTNTACVRVPAKALVQQGAGQKVFSLGAVFRREGEGYVFDDMLVGGAVEVVQSGEEAPSKDLAKQLIAAAFEALNPAAKVQEVKCSDLERKSQPSKGRWWYATGADIFVVEAGGAKKKYKTDMTSLYKGEKGKEGVDASGAWKVAFIDKPLAK